MFIVRKKFQFCAAHRLSSPHLSEEENRRIFGDCSNENYHGHNYSLQVAVAGEMDPRTGMVINFDDLKKIVNGVIIARVDHKNLNLDVDFLKGEITTAENMCRLFWKELAPHFESENSRLFEIVLSETDDNIASYRGE